MGQERLEGQRRDGSGGKRTDWVRAIYSEVLEGLVLTPDSRQVSDHSHLVEANIKASAVCRTRA